MRRATPFLVVVLVAVLVTGCGDDDTPVTSSDSMVAPSSSTTQTSPAEEPIGEMGAETRESPGFPTASREGGPALLTDVRVAGHDGFDRVTFEFRDGEVPGYRVRLVDPPITEDGSGSEVAVDGAGFLEIIMTPASGVDLRGETFEETYRGPDRFGATDATTDATAIVELVRTGDFEAVLTWHAGLDVEAPFAVGTLDSPPRLVIDVRAG